MAKPTANLPCNCIFCDHKGSYEDAGVQKFFTIADRTVPMACANCAFDLGSQVRKQLKKKVGV